MDRGELTRITRNALCFLAFVACFLLLLALSVFIDTHDKSNRNIKVPELTIRLSNTTLNEIYNGPKGIPYEGNEVVLNNNGEITHINNVEIRGRGNSSWQMNKKSYRVKFPNSIDILNLKKQNKLGLVSNNNDDSLMRNDLGQHVAGLIFDNYPIKGSFIKLNIDDKNLGVYYMIILVDVDKHSLDLEKDNGVIVEIDNAYCDGANFQRTKVFHDCVMLSDAVFEDNMEYAFSIFMNDYNRFEKALREKDYKTVSEIIDVDYWAKYYVLSEFTSNPDAFVTSWYLHKDGDDDKIKSAVGWDFDAAFGNRNWGEWADDFYNPNVMLSRIKYSIGGWDEANKLEKNCSLIEQSKEKLVSPSMCYMLTMPEFQELVAKTYRTFLMGHRAEIIEYIKETAAYIREDAINDSNIWHKGSFDDEIEYLLWWVDKRFDYFDEKYGGTSVVLYNNRYE